MVSSTSFPAGPEVATRPAADPTGAAPTGADPSDVGPPAADSSAPDLHSAADDLATRLRPALLRVSRRLRAEKADNELSDSQSAILGFVHKNGPSTPGALAAFERVTPPSMNRTINAVVDAGYATRAPSADDGRKVVISLTPAGADLVTETRRRRNAWLNQRLAELAPDDRATLERAATILRELADS